MPIASPEIADSFRSLLRPLIVADRFRIARLQHLHAVHLVRSHSALALLSLQTRLGSLERVGGHETLPAPLLGGRHWSSVSEPCS